MRPRVQLATAIAAVALFGACVWVRVPPPNPTPTPTPIPTFVYPCDLIMAPMDPGLLASLTLEPDRTEFHAGEEIKMTFSIVNCDDQENSIQYHDGQRYDFVVYDANGRQVWRWSNGMGFIQVLGKVTWAPRETISYTEAWHQLDNDGRPVPPGHYEIRGVDANCPITNYPPGSDAPEYKCDLDARIGIDIIP